MGSNRPKEENFAQLMDDGIADAACRRYPLPPPLLPSECPPPSLTLSPLPLDSLANEDSYRGVLLDVTDGIVRLSQEQPPLSPAAITRALRRIEHCVVAITEEWHTSARSIVSHWFPWIYEDFQDVSVVCPT